MTDTPAHDTHRTTCTASYDTVTRARAVATALRVETGQLDDDRSTATVTRDDRELRVTVRATDLVALRAGLNTWLRLLDTAETVVETA